LIGQLNSLIGGINSLFDRFISMFGRLGNLSDAAQENQRLVQTNLVVEGLKSHSSQYFPGDQDLPTPGIERDQR
jgi:hypothetical protein